MSIFTITWATQVLNLMPPIMRATSMQSDANGDFELTVPLPDYINRIVNSAPGSWKANPLCGVGLFYWLNRNSNPDQLKALILKQLTQDVFKQPYVDVSQYPIIVINDLVFNQNIT